MEWSTAMIKDEIISGGFEMDLARNGRNICMRPSVLATLVEVQHA
jgi:hypothetical protein